jgi:alpha-glucosidase
MIQAHGMNGVRFGLAACVALWCLGGMAHAQTAYTLRSPDRAIEVRIRAGDLLEYDVLVNEKPVLARSTLTMTIGDETLGARPAIRRATPRSHDAVIEPPVRQKAARITDRYDELRLELSGGDAVVFRAYDEGVAYRFETARSGEVVVRSETAAFRFAGDYTVYYPEEQGLHSHNERHFLPRALRDLGPGNLASIPALVDAGDVKVAITDADVDDYPGLWLRGANADGLDAVFPPVALEEQRRNDRDIVVTKTADYIARTPGTRTYPWRALAVARRDADLITNSLVYLLARPSQVADTSWIEPGKVAWDWWNANNIGGVDFAAGVNTQTYLRYIDFAAAHGLRYVILDEGWYTLGNVLQVVPAIDMEAITAHARRRNVGIILWVIWKSLEDQLDAALDRFERWGIKGLKIDFMQRDDQAVINFYHRVTREAARRKMLVDYHGGIRPALMTRTWPNLITTEGVRGMEWSKWSAHVHPEHDVTIPFTRMLLGPMDYTPGAMVNAPRGSFAPVFTRPMSQGTRCHQLAMYVVYESPLQMLADSPTLYAREPEAMAWLSAVPTAWDETRVLDARVADYAIVARRSGTEWYVGAMTDWTAREFDLDLSFLPAGTFTMESWEDGANANRRGEDTRRRSQQVTSGSRVRIRLAEGGGWAARLTPAR